MSFEFGRRSRVNLAGCDERLQRILIRALDSGIMDFAVICGHRDREAQEEAYASGHSKTRFPDSKHNRQPSIAVDVAPWPIDWKDSLAFARLAGIIQAVAAEEGHQLRWGGDWDSDGGSRDQSFMDIGHLELVE